MLACICLHLLTFACICLYLRAFPCMCLHLLAFACVCSHSLAFACICLYLLARAYICLDLLAFMSGKCLISWIPHSTRCPWLLPLAFAPLSVKHPISLIPYCHPLFLVFASCLRSFGLCQVNARLLGPPLPSVAHGFSLCSLDPVLRTGKRPIS